MVAPGTTLSGAAPCSAVHVRDLQMLQLTDFASKGTTLALKDEVALTFWSDQQISLHNSQHSYLNMYCPPHQAAAHAPYGREGATRICLSIAHHEYNLRARAVTLSLLIMRVRLLVPQFNTNPLTPRPCTSFLLL